MTHEYIAIADDDMFFIEIGDGIAWIHDLRDASHPQCIPVGIEEIPRLIEALRRSTESPAE